MRSDQHVLEQLADECRQAGLLLRLSRELNAAEVVASRGRDASETQGAFTSNGNATDHAIDTLPVTAFGEIA